MLSKLPSLTLDPNYNVDAAPLSQSQAKPKMMLLNQMYQ